MELIQYESYYDMSIYYTIYVFCAYNRITQRVEICSFKKKKKENSRAMDDVTRLFAADIIYVYHVKDNSAKNLLETKGYYLKLQSRRTYPGLIGRRESQTGQVVRSYAMHVVVDARSYLKQVVASS